MSLLSAGTRTAAVRRFHHPRIQRSPEASPQNASTSSARSSMLFVEQRCLHNDVALSPRSPNFQKSLKQMEWTRSSSTLADVVDMSPPPLTESPLLASTSRSSSRLRDTLGLSLVAAGAAVALATCVHDEEARQTQCETRSKETAQLARESSEILPRNQVNPTTNKSPDSSVLATSSMLLDPRAGIMYPHETSALPEQQTRQSGARALLGKPYDISIRAIRGRRQYMEDTYFVGQGGRFASVFDGHGGAGVSSFLRDSLYDLTIKALKAKHWEESDSEDDENKFGRDHQSNNNTLSPGVRGSVSAHVSALRTAFAEAEANVLKETRWNSQGSTAVAVWVHEKSTTDGAQRTIVSANVGDSRAILSRQGEAIDLTRDHKPNEEREKARIMRLGESIEWDGLAKVHRVRQLSLSRAIGDAHAKPIVSSEVDIKLFPVVEDKDEFVLLASDGLWDVMESQQVVSYVNDRMKTEVADFIASSGGNIGPSDVENFKLVLRSGMSRCIAREAVRRGSGDNVCVLIVWLK